MGILFCQSVLSFNASAKPNSIWITNHHSPETISAFSTHIRSTMNDPGSGMVRDQITNHTIK